MKTMTLDDVKRLPPLTEEEIARIKAFKNTDFSDCPKQTEKELSEFRPWYEVHPNGSDIYKVTITKKDIHIRIDSDVIEALKAMGKGYQTRINEILRREVLGVKKG